ncbi:hypothetical protein B0H14DRAFT_3127120 [Mycena olivaceomarginata]|nr:hypothetical protein B0H14DRAFT_3127120 [Mycena olivaceomarginata]
MQRATEEVEILTAEFSRAIEIFRKMSGIWSLMATGKATDTTAATSTSVRLSTYDLATTGRSAYAYRQAAIYCQFEADCKSTWDNLPDIIQKNQEKEEKKAKEKEKAVEAGIQALTNDYSSDNLCAISACLRISGTRQRGSVERKLNRARIVPSSVTAIATSSDRSREYPEPNTNVLPSARTEASRLLSHRFAISPTVWMLANNLLLRLSPPSPLPEPAGIPLKKTSTEEASTVSGFGLGAFLPPPLVRTSEHYPVVIAPSMAVAPSFLMHISRRPRTGATSLTPLIRAAACGHDESASALLGSAPRIDTAAD